MRRLIIRIIALSMLADGITRIIQYIFNPHATMGFLGFQATFSNYDIFGWFGTAILLIVGLQLFRLREYGRYYTAYWIGIYLAVTLLISIYVVIKALHSGLEEITIRFNFFGWIHEMGGIFAWLVALILWFLIPVAVLYFLSVPETRALFKTPVREIPASRQQDENTQNGTHNQLSQ
jgi:hypothetical protein